MMTFRIFRDGEPGAQSLLARRPLAEAAADPKLAARLQATFGEPVTPDQAVARIIAEVRRAGDAALRHWSRRIEGVELDDFVISEAEFEQARAAVPAPLYDALCTAAGRIEAFHQRQLRNSWLDQQNGSLMGQLVQPLQRVGVYAPGGRAVYPSTLLMLAVPARVAGVAEVVVASPPQPDGRVAAAVLAAAQIAGVRCVYKLGGAQAIAALALGTESIPRVDKIVGPGNIFVALAKRRLFGEVGIDQVAGPTETLLIADDSADPELIASDLLAQAEHDPMATPLLLTISVAKAEAVASAVRRQLASLPTAAVAASSLQANGGAVVVASLERAVALANAFAPEHLCLLVADPWRLLPLIRNAGGVFMGERSPEVMGDYVAGPSHVMPTGGSARFSSAGNTDDFVKISNLMALSEAEFRALAPAALTLAEAEGLSAHAAAVRIRMNKEDQHE